MDQNMYLNSQLFGYSKLLFIKKKIKGTDRSQCNLDIVTQQVLLPMLLLILGKE